MITDTDRINWIITNKADIDAPIENETWIVYTQEEQFDGGVGSSRDLRKAIDLAMQKTKRRGAR